MLELDTVYCGDNMAVMKSINKKSVHLVLTDPPYGKKIGKKGRMSGNRRMDASTLNRLGLRHSPHPVLYRPVEWDEKSLGRKCFKELQRVSKNQVIFGFNYFSNILPPSSGIVVWDKKCQTWENTFADCELIWTSFDTLPRVFRHRWQGLIRGSEQKAGDRVHPTQKPVILMEYLIERFSKPGDIILDPFLGSGTTAVACKKLDRRFIGIEQSKHDCAIARKRIDEARFQYRLFKRGINER